MEEALKNLIAAFVDSFNCGSCAPEEAKCRECLPEKQAEFLIANGVTLQDWISTDVKPALRPKEYVIIVKTDNLRYFDVVADFVGGLDLKNPPPSIDPFRGMSDEELVAWVRKHGECTNNSNMFLPLIVCGDECGGYDPDACPAKILNLFRYRKPRGQYKYLERWALVSLPLPELPEEV